MNEQMRETLNMTISFIEFCYYGTMPNAQDTGFGLVHVDFGGPMKGEITVQGVLMYEEFDEFSFSCRLTKLIWNKEMVVFLWFGI